MPVISSSHTHTQKLIALFAVHLHSLLLLHCSQHWDNRLLRFSSLRWPPGHRHTLSLLREKEQIDTDTESERILRPDKFELKFIFGAIIGRQAGVHYTTENGWQQSWRAIALRKWQQWQLPTTISSPVNRHQRRRCVLVPLSLGQRPFTGQAREDTAQSDREVGTNGQCHLNSPTLTTSTATTQLWRLLSATSSVRKARRCTEQETTSAKTDTITTITTTRQAANQPTWPP